ncbi:iron donor protein CyaY [Algibacillus agarilyticus]|uniref:iron donor protein CyaY n=1 Tax=Algibacillus agarilyticus TaxID=2234133 RepID=UPI000DD081DB|nr:iron donor protein CyaY [Algibacillus agarilyticus]
MSEHKSQLSDTLYHQKVDAIILKIEEALDILDETDLDFDFESNGGKLDIEFADRSKIIINKQEPLHQIWVATKFNGYHFNYHADTDQWIDERFGDEFWHFIDAAASKQAGRTISLKG